MIYCCFYWTTDSDHDVDHCIAGGSGSSMCSLDEKDSFQGVVTGRVYFKWYSIIWNFIFLLFQSFLIYNFNIKNNSVIL